MRAARFGFACLFLALFAALPLDAPALAAATPQKKVQTLPQAPDDLDLVNVGKVTEIKRSDLITLSNGKTYRLDQIRVPLKYEAAAVSHLKNSILGRVIGIYVVKDAKEGVNDRYGNPYAHVMRDDGVWVQADMVARGLAWAYSTETNRTLILPLYKYETSARLMKAGFWRDPEFAIKNKSNIDRYFNSYQIYQGYIGAYKTGEEDSSIHICDADSAQTPALSFSISADRLDKFTSTSSSWIGALVRVRGWVEKDHMGRPYIEVTHPEQIAFIDPSTGEPTTKVR